MPPGSSSHSSGHPAQWNHTVCSSDTAASSLIREEECTAHLPYLETWPCSGGHVMILSITRMTLMISLHRAGTQAVWEPPQPAVEIENRSEMPQEFPFYVGLLTSAADSRCFLFFSPIRSVQLLSRVRLFATPLTAARQASLSIANSQSLLKLMSIESVMPSNHLILVIHFSSWIQSFPVSGSVQMSQFFTWGGQSMGVSASASVLPMNIQDWFPWGSSG